MTYLLPAPRVSRLRKLLQSKQVRYRIAALIDLFLIILILINGKQPAQRMISPMVSSIQSFYSQTVNKTTQESFAFVPGLAQNKFSDIDLEGLTYLSFFDIPLTEDGEINMDSRGFYSFTSDETTELFDRARYQKTKILVTLSAHEEDTIRNVLNNSQVQQTLADQAIKLIKSNNIDGITIDFEFPNNGGSSFQKQYTDFISLLTNKVHQALPQALVVVAIPSELTNNQSFYNIEKLSKVSDKILMIASDFIVPEVKENKPINPIYGITESKYWEDTSHLLGNLFKRVASSKLVMERAWYGNGDRYPLYVPSSHPVEERNREASDITLDSQTIEKLAQGVPAKGREAAKRNIPLIAKALKEEGILDSNVLAYAIATVEHETDETFEPIEEIQGRFSARRLGYEGGMNYFGRGFIQITHLRNYRVIGERIGLGDQLAKNPSLASNPEIAAKILAAYFADNNVANLASRGAFIAARRPINPDYNGYSVARLAMKYVE